MNLGAVETMMDDSIHSLDTVTDLLLPLFHYRPGPAHKGHLEIDLSRISNLVGKSTYHGIFLSRLTSTAR